LNFRKTGRHTKHPFERAWATLSRLDDAMQKRR
jgi:hypothetical protein